MRFEHYFTGVAANVTAALILGLLAASGLPIGHWVARQADELQTTEDTPVKTIEDPGIDRPPTPDPPPPPPPPRKPRPQPAPADPYIKVQKTCEDTQGNEGTFDVVLFSRAYSWVQGDTENVELNDTPADFPQLLRTSALGDYLRESPEIVALGTASCEGFPEHRDREVERARKRANKLLGWIEEVRRPRPEWKRWKPVKPLPLGVFARTCRPGEETWSQRRVVLLAVRERDEDLLLFDCLRQTLEKDDELSYLATDYTPGFPGAQARGQEIARSP